MKIINVTCHNCKGSGDKVLSRGNHSSVFATGACHTCGGRGEKTLDDIIKDSGLVPSPWNYEDHIFNPNFAWKKYMEQRDSTALVGYIESFIASIKESNYKDYLKPISFRWFPIYDSVNHSLYNGLTAAGWYIKYIMCSRPRIEVIPQYKFDLLQTLVPQKIPNLANNFNAAIAYFKTKNIEMGGHFESFGDTMFVSLKVYQGFIRFTVTKKELTQDLNEKKEVFA